MCVLKIFRTYQINCFQLKPVPNSCVMFSYKYLKSFGSKINFTILPPCKQDSLFQSLNAVKVENDQSRSLHKSCLSQSCRSDSHLLNRSETKSWSKGSKKVTRKEFSQKSVNHQNSTKSIPNRELSTRKSNESREQNEPIKYRYQEYEPRKQEKYELEAAKPKRDTNGATFDVFKSVCKEIDLNGHLQPSNLKPYGAHDHMYSAVLMTNKNSCLAFTNPSYLPPDRLPESKNKLTSESDEEDDTEEKH